MRTLDFVRLIINSICNITTKEVVFRRYEDVVEGLGVEFIPSVELKIKKIFELESDYLSRCDWEADDVNRVMVWAAWDMLIMELQAIKGVKFFPPIVWNGKTTSLNNSFDEIPF